MDPTLYHLANPRADRLLKEADRDRLTRAAVPGHRRSLLRPFRSRHANPAR